MLGIAPLPLEVWVTVWCHFRKEVQACFLRKRSAKQCLTKSPNKPWVSLLHVENNCQNRYTLLRQPLRCAARIGGDGGEPNLVRLLRKPIHNFLVQGALSPRYLQPILEGQSRVCTQIDQALGGRDWIRKPSGLVVGRLSKTSKSPLLMEIPDHLVIT